MIDTILYCLLALFILNSLGLAMVIAQEDDSPWYYAVALSIVAGPVIVWRLLIEAGSGLTKRLDSWLQFRTFWYYCFNRKKLIVPKEIRDRVIDHNNRNWFYCKAVELVERVNEQHQEDERA